MSVRFDINFGTGPLLDYHFCREWDEEGGCYGSRADHGMSFEDARTQIVEWLRSEAARWEKMTLAEWEK